MKWQRASESGRKCWDNFYADFQKKLEKAQGSATDSNNLGMRNNDPVETAIQCPTCSRPMQIRTGTTGVFLGCSGYALDPKERCKTTINLISGDEIADDDDAEVRQLRAKHRCKKCNTAMDGYLIDETRKLHVCGNNPDCDGYEIETGQYKLKGYEGPLITCDKCSSDMQLKARAIWQVFWLYQCRV